MVVLKGVSQAMDLLEVGQEEGLLLLGLMGAFDGPPTAERTAISTHILRGLVLDDEDELFRAMDKLMSARRFPTVGNVVCSAPILAGYAFDPDAPTSTFELGPLFVGLVAQCAAAEADPR